MGRSPKGRPGRSAQGRACWIGTVLLIGLIIGAGLGSFFRVFVLIPVTFVSLILGVSVSVAYKYNFQLSAIALIVICPQIGYLAGVGIQAFFKALQISRTGAAKPPARVPVTQPAE